MNVKRVTGKLARGLRASRAPRCLACERPLGPLQLCCPYCGEQLPATRGRRAGRLLLPALSAALLAFAVMSHPGLVAAWPAALVSAWRAAGDRAASALLLSLALAAALWPAASAGCAPGAPLPGALGRALRKALGQVLLGAAAAQAGLLIAPPGAAWRWTPLLAWLSLLPLPQLFGLAWTPLLAGPLVWLATA